MTPFKIGVISVFGVFILLGVLVFALSRTSGTKISGNLVVWGTMSNAAFEALYSKSSIREGDVVSLTYVKKEQSDFDRDFVEALAEGKGPDIVILRDDSVYKHRNKLFTIPYKSYTERSFKDTFIEEAEIFLTPEGVIAVPLMVDPMVMYWNRDMFSNALISQPPQYWDQIYSILEKTTKKDSNANVMQSTIALGEWKNITNAKEIITMLFLQAGTPIVSRQADRLTSVLNDSFGQTVAPSQSSINFYTQFSNPTSNFYTWNRSLPTSLNMFLAGNLAMYLGFSSEIFSIQQKNPNLNFDVTYVPQTRNTAKKSVFGHMYFFSITKQSKNIAGAFTAINALTEPSALKSLETVTNLPPVRRDMLVDKPADAFRSVFYNSALISDSWIDPEPDASSSAFRDMIESITSGRSRASEALGRLSDEINAQLR
ncbi:MAG: hypothetical protein AB198_00715 [Parcubacteria bacterium C7867-003]|nr:MAG: hypothetical protein AB198_00715 [Parcubacteria bacterium C7867-003]